MMKKLVPMYLRILIAFFTFFGLLEYFIDSGDRPAFVKYPILLLVLVVFMIFLVTVEYVIAATNNIIYQLTPEEKRAQMAVEEAVPLRERNWYKKLMEMLTRSEPVENNELVMLDHNYDGIRELDNRLPPWWLYLFYSGIIFGAIYLVKYEILGGDNQEMELRKEMLQAKADLEQYKKIAPDMMDEQKVTQLTDAPSLAIGKSIFEGRCAACHRADGGGQIGPNLTDDHWIFGGDIKTVFHTITHGGRDGKGMVAWNGTLKPTQIQHVASYVLSLQGSHPKNPKAPEGDLYVPKDVKTGNPSAKP